MWSVPHVPIVPRILRTPRCCHPTLSSDALLGRILRLALPKEHGFFVAFMAEVSIRDFYWGLKKAQLVSTGANKSNKNVGHCHIEDPHILDLPHYSDIVTYIEFYPQLEVAGLFWRQPFQAPRVLTWPVGGSDEVCFSPESHRVDPLQT